MELLVTSAVMRTPGRTPEPLPPGPVSLPAAKMPPGAPLPCAVSVPPTGRVAAVVVVVVVADVALELGGCALSAASGPDVEVVSPAPGAICPFAELSPLAERP